MRAGWRDNEPSPMTVHSQTPARDLLAFYVEAGSTLCSPKPVDRFADFTAPDSASAGMRPEGIAT